jgi:hypothetical protein
LAKKVEAKRLDPAMDEISFEEKWPEELKVYLKAAMLDSEGSMIDEEDV